MSGDDNVEVSKGGLALAQHIAPAYFDNPKVRVVMVGGSVSRGCADQYSDLEIGVFWAEPPYDEERKLVIQRAGAELLSFEPYTADAEWGAGEHWEMSEVVINSQRHTSTPILTRWASRTSTRSSPAATAGTTGTGMCRRHWHFTRGCWVSPTRRDASLVSPVALVPFCQRVYLRPSKCGRKISRPTAIAPSEVTSTAPADTSLAIRASG
jgi:hypothetical protein